MMATPENTGKIQSGKFKRGESGNPAGRPAGARNKTTLAMQALLDGEAEALTRKAIELALGGDMAALRLCLERLLPSRRDMPVTINLPPIVTAADTVRAMSAILEAVGLGELTPVEGEALAGLVEGQRRTIETAMLEKRLQALTAVLEARRASHA